MFRVLSAVCAGVLLLSVPATTSAQAFPDASITDAAPDSFLVAFDTSKGPFEVMAYRAWSPLAVDRFYHLVRRGYYDGNVIFRVVENFVVQFGINEVEEVTTSWSSRAVPDEPVVASNVRGAVSFARGGPMTRTSQIFINLGDNPRLDTLDAGGVRGYPPIGRVVSGMEQVVDAFFAEYGNAPSMHQDSIRVHGRAWLDREFPGLDHVNRARIVREYPPAGGHVRRSGK
jgi:peptidyl-prolyl cis-trans isomerase A (cyclophilin A)